MASDNITGKAGNVSVAGVAIKITKWGAKSKKEMAKRTDSGDYVPATKQLWTAQLPGEQNLEGTIEGHWNRTQTPSGIIAKLTSDDVLPVVLKLDESTNYASFAADLSEVEVTVDVPGAEMIDFTAKFMSNGPVTYA